MKTILVIQKISIALGVFLLAVIPIANFLSVEGSWVSLLYQISFGAVFLVMIVRPLSDIFQHQMWLKRLVILRKGFGILSASIIIGFMIGKVLSKDSVYLESLFSSHFFSFSDYAFFAYIGDISGLILLVTSNRFSQRLLKRNWKRIHKLAYVYFYAGAIYEGFFLDSMFALYASLVVTNVVVIAWAIKKIQRSERILQAA